MPLYKSINNDGTEDFWFLPAESHMDEDAPYTENISKDKKDLRRKIDVVQHNDGMIIVAVAISNDEDKNFNQSIPCYRGDPLNTNVHDLVKDNYYVHCFSYLDLGEIPVNYKICVDGVHDWSVDIPLPLNIIKRYLDDDRKKKLKDWQDSLEDCTIETLQMIEVY